MNSFGSIAAYRLPIATEFADPEVFFPRGGFDFIAR